MSLLVALVLSPSAYLAGEINWRAAEERAIRASEGWLAVAGLHWLDDRLATVGSSPTCDVRLANVPALMGTVTRTNDRVYFSPEPRVQSLLDGELVRGMVELRSDAEGKPGRLRFGDDVLTVIRRGKRIGIRVYDPQNPRRTAFKGLRWYPVDPKYRIVARFVPVHRLPMKITNVLGDVSLVPCPGYAEFQIGGKICRLDAEAEGKTYFFNFGDRTNNRTTYRAGRFLDADAPKNGRIVLDFNRATNPPCAFTDFATCPLPPRQNLLNVAISAGALNGHASP